MKIPDDPFIIELLPEFIETWMNDLNEQFPELIKNKNADELYRFGHTLKGSCFQFGLDEVAEIGIELMGYAKENNWEKASEMEGKIRQAFINMKEFVEKSLNK